MKEIILILLLPISIFAQINEPIVQMDLDYYGNGQLHWKGNMSITTDHSMGFEMQNQHQTGLWQYWYKNGQIKAETIYEPNGKTKYINMWSSILRQMVV